MFKYIEKFFKELQFNPTKLYLILANVVLVSFAIWFSNVGLLPFKNFGDFAVFAVLALILGLYRPGWTFLFFVGALALENINLVPKEIGLSLRPYQFFGFITIIALLVQALSKRLAFSLPKFAWYDAMPIVFAVAGFLSVLGATNKGMSFKQSIIALTFVALYFLTRIYVQSFDDAKRVLPFFLSTGLVVMIYSIWQNIRFLTGGNSFEVMLGRPNGTFTEADWLGIFITFVLAVLLTLLYALNRNYIKDNAGQISNFQFPISNKFLNVQIFKQIGIYLFLTIGFVVLILTVSRSAWVGAVFVVVVFLKFFLLGNYAELGEGERSGWKRLLNILKMQKWQWKKAGTQTLFVLLALAVALAIAMPLTRFQLASRAASTAGLQKITVACHSSADNIVPQKILSVDELGSYGCRHINLEDIEKEKALGNMVIEVDRPDPNVNIRAEIYQKSWQQIKSHPVFGIGWGNISQILGTDERGAGLNASNIFLEVWLGSGLLGIFSFVMLLGYILALSIGAFLDNGNKYKNGVALLFVMAGWVAIVFPNLFNSGIFLGFVWAYIGIAVGLLESNKAGNK
ncbi:MAG: O-antigen ligase family protein [Candidatus Moranbacteria bacterium]|nr:O-antigen ligase family protein [Candidatus Moranbacteria bacterium]